VLAADSSEILFTRYYWGAQKLVSTTRISSETWIPIAGKRLRNFTTLP
jgi:hypothetical protein